MRLGLASRIVTAVLLAAGAGSMAMSPAEAAGPRASGVSPPYERLIHRVAHAHRIDPKLLGALVEAESARSPSAVSPRGARGLAQLMPATARRFGVADLHDPEENLHGAARYLRWLLDRYRGDVRLAVAAYNAGEGAVDRHRGVPPFPETRAFVRKVLSRAGLWPSEKDRTRTDAARPVRLERRPSGRWVVTNR